jgi:hypothetical protein
VIRGRGQDAAGCIRQFAVGPLTNRVGPFTAQQRGNLKWYKPIDASASSAASLSVGSIVPPLQREVVLVFTHEMVLDRSNVGVVELNLSARSRALRKNDLVDDMPESIVVDVPEHEEHVDLDSFSESSGSESEFTSSEDDVGTPVPTSPPPPASPR